MRPSRGALWVTRPRPRNAVTARVLDEAGFEVVAAPVLEIRFPATVSVIAPEPGDWVVLVSANAVEGLDRALDGKTLASEVRVAAIGKRTAELATRRGWRVEVVPARENAEGLLDAMANVDLRGKRVWIPAGNREGSASLELPGAFGEMGAEVSVLRVYETVDRAPLPDEDAALAAARPGAVIFHSPSAADAVFSLPSESARRWRSAAPGVAIGPSTAARLRALGAKEVWVSERPSDMDLLALLEKHMGRKRP